jgi:hypothetical protein
MSQTDEIIVRFKAEGGETVEEAFRRVGAAGDKAGGGTDRVNKSLDGLRLKSEERVARNLGAIATELAHGGSAADIAALAISRFGESFKGAFSVAAAGAVGFGLYEAITRTGEAIIKLNSEVIALTRPRGGSDFLGMDALNKDLTDVSAKIHEISANQITRSHSLLSGILGTGGGAPTAGIIPALNKSDQEKINALQKASAEIVSSITEKTQNLNKIEYDRAHVSELQAELDKSEVEHKERLGVLAAAAAAAGISGTKQAKESLSAENERAQIEAGNIRKKSDLDKEAVDHTELLADIEKRGLSTRDETIQKLQEEVLYRQNLVALAGNEEEKAQALANVSQAQANLVKFAREAAFQQSVNLSYARAVTDSIRLQLNDQDILADAVEKRAAAEAKIKQLLHDGQNELAGQIALQSQLNSAKSVRTGKQNLVSEQAQENLKSVSQKYQDLNQNNQLFDQLRSEAFRRGIEPPEPPKFGEAYHPFQPSEDEKFNELNQAQDIGSKDFSGVSALAGQDFTGVAGLAGLDFSGIEALSNISISIK